MKSPRLPLRNCLGHYFTAFVKKNNIDTNKPSETKTEGKIPFYQYIFSVKNIDEKKVIRILGLKFSFKRK